MPADGDTKRPRRVLSKGRMEAFSDGVLAIAITLLVLDVAVHPPGTPLEQVLHAWPAYVAYVVSFLTIGAAWLGHTALTDRLAQSDSIFLRLNLLLLLVVAFLPFPTRLVADALQHTYAERVAVTFYGLTFLAIRLLGSGLAEYARRERLYSPPGEGEEPPGGQRKLLSVVIGYVIAIVVGLVWPAVAVAVYFAIAIYLVVPFREVARLLSGVHDSRSGSGSSLNFKITEAAGDACPSPGPRFHAGDPGPPRDGFPGLVRRCSRPAALHRQLVMATVSAAVEHLLAKEVAVSGGPATAQVRHTVDCP